MIENEMAKLEKPDQRTVQVLRVPELGKVLLVVGQLVQCPSALMWNLLGS